MVGDTSPPDVPDCQKKMKCKDIPSSIVTINAADHEPSVDMNQVICLKRYISSHRLFRVTILVLRFVKRFHGAYNTHSTVQPGVEEITQAKLK